MDDFRVYICSAPGEKQRGAEVARQLIRDLRTVGIEVVGGERLLSQDYAISCIRQELARCRYVLLIQTPLALACTYVQTTVGLALQMCARHELQGIWSLLAEPSAGAMEQPSWSPVRFIDASQNYGQARARLLRGMGLG